ncbi:MAG: DNA primase, partial [Erysipelotrichaceae bacterium]|nr:DNA primase [Erysipelotrichaceae bacterium]
MAFIPDQVIEDIKKKARIEDIISHYIDVQQKGRNYVAICPFHDDHDPSLQISSEKQLFKCFVCGTGGDVFSFVSHYEKIGYAEAV